jgi:hypothetical protein
VRQWGVLRRAKRLHLHLGTSQLRQAEIEDLHLSARRHEDVGWLDIAVDDALCVRGVERIGKLNGYVEQAIEWEWSGV